jgi:hypothetical protein
LNQRPHPYQGFCARACFPRIARATCANEVPLETVANRLVPMACGPSVDQARDAQRTGRLGSGALVGGSRTGPTRAPSLRPTRRSSLLSLCTHVDRSATGASGITLDAPLLDDQVSAHHGLAARIEGFEPCPRLLRRPGSERWVPGDLRFSYAEPDARAPARTSGSPFRTGPGTDQRRWRRWTPGSSLVADAWYSYL